MASVKTQLEAEEHVLCVSEFITDKLFFVTFSNTRTHHSTDDVKYLNTDKEVTHSLMPTSYFGPPALDRIAKYITKINSELWSSSKAIVHYTSCDEKTRSYAAVLMGIYAVVQLQMSPDEAFNNLHPVGHPFLSFQVSMTSHQRHNIEVIDCLNAIYKAVCLGLVNFDDFNVEEFDGVNGVGCISWIVPQKFLAFPTPKDNPTYYRYRPEFYLDYFKDNSITTVIRLCKRKYDAQKFTNAGLSHYDLYFPDGTVPPMDILNRFLEIVENTTGAVAVHCQAGLGRTGSLIGAYLVNHYRMTAREAIAWMRICRPGCVQRLQQAWLEDMEPYLWNMGDNFRTFQFGSADHLPQCTRGVYSYLARTSVFDNM